MADPLGAIFAARSDPAASPAAPPAPAPANERAGAPRPPAEAGKPSGDVSRLLALLADKTRMRILRLLVSGERPVVALTSELRLPQPTVSHHLAWLRMMNLVAPRRQGKHVFYALGPAVTCGEDGTMTLAAADATVTLRPRSVA